MLRRPKRTYRYVLYKKKISLKDKNLNGYLIYSLSNSLLRKEAIEAARIVISKIIRKKKYINKRLSRKKTKGTLKVLVKCTTPITKKGSKSRMGKGKGSLKEYQAFVHINDVLFCLQDVPLKTIRSVVSKIKYKLGISINYLQIVKDDLSAS